MPIPLPLAGLTPREAIKDTAYRLARSFDHADLDAFNSVITEDMIVEFHIMEKKIMTGSEIRTEIFDRVAQLDTTHMLSNFRIHVKEDGKEADMQCYTLSQHCPFGRGKEVGAPKYLGAAEFTFELVFDEMDGLWRIRKWVAELVWGEGDVSVIS